jgi:hypothetical protein
MSEYDFTGNDLKKQIGLNMRSQGCKVPKSSADGESSLL